MAGRLRILVGASLLAMTVALLSAGGAVGDAIAGDVTPTPQADCGPGSDPETAEQGRVPAQDYASGRTQRPYTCNTEVVGHVPGTGGFKVHRYIDAQGTECAFYDTNMLVPVDVLNQLTSQGLGVAVLDMSDPANPVVTDNLVTPAMLSPHESLELNQERGLLAAVMGTALTYPGIVDIYDVSEDCTSPTLMSSSPVGFLGHEAGFSPDGLTYYTAATAFSSVAAIDVSDPAHPRTLVVENLNSHGITVSEDGTRIYLTPLDIDAQVLPTFGAFSSGVAIVDTTEIQERRPNPRMHVISQLTWPHATIAQTAIPVTIDGSPYLVEIDEFVSFADFLDPLTAVPGVGRIIDISDEAAPFVVANLRLEVHHPDVRPGLAGDPGSALGFTGYSGHYCAVPQRVEPGIVACSMIGSGLRVFDIRDPRAPVEIAYFNAPPGNVSPTNPDGAPLALSAPAFVPERSEIWYSDNASGFWVVRVTNDVWPFASDDAPDAAPSPEPVDTVDTPAAPVLPATGPLLPLALAGALLAVSGFAALRRRW